MHWIVCLDERDGMAFNHRRQSRDRLLRRRLLSRVGTGRLWMNGYSAGQFTESDAGITVDEEFLQKAGAEDFCFVENVDVTPFLHRVTSVTVYRWHTVYPADLRFPWDRFARRQLREIAEFAGHSHDRITEEVYEV